MDDKRGGGHFSNFIGDSHVINKDSLVSLVLRNLQRKDLIKTCVKSAVVIKDRMCHYKNICAISGHFSTMENKNLI